MTARGELFLDEDCRDAFSVKLDRWFGKDKWYLPGSQLSDTWKDEDIPSKIMVDIKDDKTRNPIGKVLIRVKFHKEYDDFSGNKTIFAEPRSIKLIRKYRR